jgi:hypothetical protein
MTKVQSRYLAHRLGRLAVRLLPAFGIGIASSGCLSTESGNPENANALASTPGPGPSDQMGVPSGMSTSTGPSPTTPPAGNPPPATSTPPAGNPPPTTSTPPTSPPPGATDEPIPSAAGSANAADDAVAPCEFSDERDAGAPSADAGSGLYRCTAIDGGVACNCGTGSAEPGLSAGQLLPAGEACTAALLEQCGREFP